ncbi:efflux transporter outer membrane subunit [Chromobacterium violaceum]|uniref:efflux transporter outer membrane subunit n=1 Tax=Chromobacterium violaceum TaxID=536 RepID=UPI0015F7A73F|nr:efflux transporter outer membrane subunit [Chromobacterium violaceum]MBA8734741.1 efflux transporter outer membrane subunit [Chromobacterium violaceum]
MRALPLLLAAALSGCAAVGPDYRPPASELPAQWKSDAGWLPAAPADTLPKRDWWRMFGDEDLNRLEADALASSPTLQLALARLDQAQAQSRIRGAAALPAASLGAAASRSRVSADRPLSSYGASNASTVQSDLKPMLSVSYEIDWLGRVRRDIESARAGAEQAAADRANVELLLTAQLASAYLQLRQEDEEIRLLDDILDAQQRVLELTRIRHLAGLASAGDEAQQAATVAASRAQRELLLNQRRANEDLLATLSGAPTPSFRLASGSLPAALPALPSGAPSDLLQCRPDIASAERAMAAANAQIGVAKAAYFPQLTLTPAYLGSESTGLAQLFSTPALIWGVGLQATQTLFDNGKARAGVDYAAAGYRAALAAYRQTVLQALQEAQDALGSLHGLDQARRQQDEAARNQDKAYAVIQLRYREGLDSALTLASARQSQLAAQRTLAQLRGAQLAASVSLLKALGGGWQAPFPRQPF